MKLHYYQVGQGQPLIIVHGLFGEGENWRTIAERMGESATVYPIDLRNHGRSPHTVEFTFEQMAEDISEFMRDRGLCSAVLLGHSMGGKVVMQCAANFPSLARKLIVVDVGPTSTGGAFSGAILETLYHLPLSSMRTRREIDDALGQSIDDRRTRLFLMKDIQRGDDGVFRWRIGINELYRNREQMRAEVKLAGPCRVPSLFITGGGSEYVTEQEKARIAELFPQSTVARIEGAGHWVHVDAPDAFVRWVMGFL